MKNRVIALIIMWFFYFVDMFGIQYLGNMNETIRVKSLIGPLLLSIAYFFRDIYDMFDKKYKKNLIILSVLNVIFFISYIFLLNKYIALGLF